MNQVLIDKEADKRMIQEAYRGLLEAINASAMEPGDRENIHAAYVLAVEAHFEQRRKSGEPYVLHPIEVARICAIEIGLGPTAIVAAILHDVVEDTPVTIEEIEAQFGPKIRLIVDGLTKLDGLYNVESPQAENFKKVIRSLLDDVRVVLIKMADRLHNMRTLGSMPRHKQLKIAAETDYIYAPMAHRLGLYKIKTEFQDLIMKVKETEIYTDIVQKLKTSETERKNYVSAFIKPLKKALEEIPFPYRITGRPKSIYSIWNKIKTKKVPFEQIYDLFAIRIIIDAPSSKEKQVCWQVYSIVTDVHTPIPERLKDWVTTPKSNGYESLHTTVIGPKGRYVEVQIRTERMDDIAERGFAAHWKYKGVITQEDIYDKWLDNIREILEHNETDAIEFLNDFKTNLFHEEVYVYTPKGDMRILPKGATALDFAFEIHSDVGYHCTSIKVNNKLVPMGYKLQSGDQLQVVTNKSQRPSEGWLKMVVTGKARSRIRSAMKEERRKQGELGKESLQRKLKNMKVDWEEGVESLVKFFKYPNRGDLYYDIAHDDLHLSEIKEHFSVEHGKLIPIPDLKVEEHGDNSEVVKKRPRKQKWVPKLLINGSPDQYEYQLATCCKPVQGDDVFAYLSANAGLKVHRTTCPNATNLIARYGYRVMKAEWVTNTNTSFVADLIITGIDSGPGVIEKLTSNITSLGLNIRSFYIDGNEGYFEGKISLLVSNKDQLNKVIHELKNLDGISSVIRKEA